MSIEATTTTKDRRAHRSVAKLHGVQVQTREIGLNSEKHRRAETARINKLFGERMYQARVTVNGWSQQYAAQLLGYKTSSPLTKIEMGGKFPIWLPAVAAKVYRVSVDYLLGVVDFDYECKSPGSEWERDIIQADQGIFKIFMEQHAQHLHKFADITKTTVNGTATVMKDAQAIIEMFERVTELNPDVWAEVKGGTRLENAIEQFKRTCNDVRRSAERTRTDLKRTAHLAGISQTLNGKLDFDHAK